MTPFNPRIYYGDGSVYEGDPKTAPRLNVQVVVCEDSSINGYQVGHLCLHSWDYYLRVDGNWLGVNGEADLVDHILFEDVDVVLKGRMISHGRFQQILAEATAFKKNWHKNESGRRLQNGVVE